MSALEETAQGALGIRDLINKRPKKGAALRDFDEWVAEVNGDLQEALYALQDAFERLEGCKSSSMTLPIRSLLVIETTGRKPDRLELPKHPSR